MWKNPKEATFGPWDVTQTLVQLCSASPQHGSVEIRGGGGASAANLAMSLFVDVLIRCLPQIQVIASPARLSYVIINDNFICVYARSGSVNRLLI